MIIKHTLTSILFLILSTQVYSQTQPKDTRARFKTSGGANELSVSPTGVIWRVTNSGTVYFADSIDGYWHNHKQFIVEDEYSFSNPYFKRISFFNGDTAIMSGYFSKNKKYKDGLYRTTNGGKSWKLISFGGDSWISDAFINSEGRAWIGGSSGHIYYSDNFGLKWKKLKVSFKSDRMHTLCMEDNTNGMAGAVANKILTTTNNWKTTKSIETPFDQNRYKNKKGEHNDNQIEKIRYWNNYIVVNQQGHTYYTDRTAIKWVEFPIKIIDFETGSNGKELYAFTKNNELVKFSTTNQYDILFKQNGVYSFADMKVGGDAVYCQLNSAEIYKITADAVVKNNYYTLDYPIATPELQQKGASLTWGVDRGDIYLSDDYGKTWFRDTAVNFYTNNFYLKNDSTAVLWNGYRNYIYSLATREIKEYTPEHPIDEFIKSKPVSITIASGTYGCEHYYFTNIYYKLQHNNIFGVEKLSFGDSIKPCSLNFNADRLTEALQSINNNPYSSPTLADFNIIEQDKKNYLELIRKKAEEKSNWDNPFDDEKKTYCINFLNGLDTIDKYLPHVLNIGNVSYSTTYKDFSVKIINENNDTLSIHSLFYEYNFWQTPINVTHKGKNFRLQNIALQQLIKDILPKEFYGTYTFDNANLLYFIADSFYQNYLNYQKNTED